MGTIAEDLALAVDKALGASEIMDQVANGPASDVVQTLSGPVPTINKWFADKESSVTTYLDDKFDAVIGPVTEQAESARQANYSAIDAAQAASGSANRAQQEADRAEQAVLGIATDLTVTAAGTEAHPDTDSWAVFAGRIAYMLQAKVAAASALTAGTNVIPMASFVGDAVDPTHFTGFSVVGYRSGAIVELAWQYLPATNEIQIDGATAGDVPIAVQRDIGGGDISTAPVNVDGVSRRLDDWLTELAKDASDLPSAELPLDGNEMLEVIQGGASCSVRVMDLTSGFEPSTGPFIRLQDKGAIGDGVADDTVAFQAALDEAAAVGGTVIDEPGATYKVSVLRVKNGTRGVIMKRSTIIPDASTAGVTTGALQLDGTQRLAGGPPVSKCTIAVRMDMQNGGRCAIFADGCTECTFIDCDIYGFTNSATVNHYGILFWYGSSRNNVLRNKIVGVTNPTMRGLLVDFIGQSDAFSGYFANSGSTTRASVPCLDNIVAHNRLLNGSYGVNLLGCENTLVSNNVCKGQNHRAIYLAESCAFNLITNNQLLDFLSTAVLLGYGCIENEVTGNICKREVGVQSPGTGEAVINVNTGARLNLIAHNKIFADTNYGIYLACTVQHNMVIGNEVRGYYLAGIAMESDWEAIADRPAGAIYSRPNYQTPGSVATGATQWAFGNADGNTIKGNIIREGAAGRSVAGIYIAQVNSNTNLSVVRNNISENEVFGNADMAHYIYVYEETSGRAVNNKLSGNKFTDVSGIPSASKVFLSRGRLHFNHQENNDVIDSVVTTFADGDTTPSVAYGGSFLMNNSSPTSVTFFDDGVDGQEFTTRLSINTTLVHDNTKLRLKGATNVTGVSGSNFMRFRRENGVWFEMYRNF